MFEHRSCRSLGFRWRKRAHSAFEFSKDAFDTDIVDSVPPLGLATSHKMNMNMNTNMNM